MKRKNCKKIVSCIIDCIEGSKLKELYWDYDFSCSTSTAERFLTAFAELESCSIKKLSMIGVFNDKKNRD